MPSSFLVIQMLLRERLKHQVQEKKCNLCDKRNQVCWAYSGGEIKPRHNWNDFDSNGVIGHYINSLVFLILKGNVC